MKVKKKDEIKRATEIKLELKKAETKNANSHYALGGALAVPHGVANSRHCVACVDCTVQ